MSGNVNAKPLTKKFFFEILSGKLQSIYLSDCLIDPAAFVLKM